MAESDVNVKDVWEIVAGLRAEVRRNHRTIHELERKMAIEKKKDVTSR